jgi:hypothetical protein
MVEMLTVNKNHFDKKANEKKRTTSCGCLKIACLIGFIIIPQYLFSFIKT